MNFLKSTVFKMDKRIYFVFIFVVSVAIANAVLSTIKIRNNKNTIFEITQYTNPTLENLEEFNLLVTRSRMFISNWVYLPNNSNDKSSLVQLNQVNYPRLKSKLIALTRGWRSDGNEKKMEKLFVEYETVIREQEKIMKSLVKFDDYQDPMRKFLAEEQLESEIIPNTNRIMVNLRELITIKKEEARQMQNAMLEDNVHLLVIVFSLAILVIVSVMMAGAYMMKKIILPLMRVREVLLQMSAGELPEVKIDNDRSALSEMKTALYQLREGLQRTSSFAGEIGRGNFNANFQALSEKDVLGSALLDMRNKLKRATDDDAIRNWASEGYAHISSVLHKNTVDITKLSDDIICGLVSYIEAKQGGIYLVNDTQPDHLFIELISLHSVGAPVFRPQRLEMDDGIIGNVVSSNLRIHTNINNENTDNPEVYILVLPLFSGGRVIGALEILSETPLVKSRIAFIERISEPVAANMLNLKSNLLTRQLLEESQIKTTELALQDEELRQINNELMLQSGKLKQSESTLRKQSETLQKVNSELENKALLLEEKNMAVEDAHKALALKAEQLERSNKYKSDFLANMSHELRTPLNSVLILAKLLSENRAGNMTDKQVEHARVIHKSGSDLLVIINDILDLSKIEAGKLQLQKENTLVGEICNNMVQLFMEVSRDKRIYFTAIMDPSLPVFIKTDRVRIEQVLKNLLGNAFKFTPANGNVTLKISIVNEKLNFQSEKLNQAETIICFAVYDSGIGIPEDKQKLIFDAFNQADSSITRKFGGTGLGLAICRQLAALLGGEITLTSKEGEGSVFQLYLSADADLQADLSQPNSDISNDIFEEIAATTVGSVLLICDDKELAQTWEVLLRIENYNVQCLKVSDEINSSRVPDIVIVDATLSDKEYIAYIQKLKEHSITKNAYLVCRSVSEFIPAQIKSLIKFHTTAPLNAMLVSSLLELVSATGLIPPLAQRIVLPGEFKKPGISFSNDVFKNHNLSGVKVLIADDDIRNIYSMTSVFENEGAEVLCAMDGYEAVEIFKNTGDLKIILMDVMMPGKDGLQAIREIRAMKINNLIPIIAVTAKAMRDDREICISAGASEYITKPVNIDMLLVKVYDLLKSIHV